MELLRGINSQLGMGGGGGGGGGGGVYSGFQVTWMIEGCLWRVSNFLFLDYGGRKIWQVLVGVSSVVKMTTS